MIADAHIIAFVVGNSDIKTIISKKSDEIMGVSCKGIDLLNLSDDEYMLSQSGVLSDYKVGPHTEGQLLLIRNKLS